MDPIEIIRSWATRVRPSEKQKQDAEQRLQICNQCPAIVRNPIMRCRVCGCPLRAKVFSPKSDACPQHRWPDPEKVEKISSRLI